VNDVTVADEKMMLTPDHLTPERRHQALARTQAPRPAQAGVIGPGRRAVGRDRVYAMSFFLNLNSAEWPHAGQAKV
jgi:hypothetical protein